MQAAGHIRFDGRCGLKYQMSGEAIVAPKESVGATRLTGPLSWDTCLIARCSAVM